MRAERGERQNLYRRAQQLTDAVLAGMALAIGCTAYVTVEHAALGSFLFSIGIFTIVTSGMALFTGKLCFLLDEGGPALSDLLVYWIGNLVGVAAVGYALRLTRLAPTITVRVAACCEARLNDSWLSIFLLGVFCNFLVCMGVQNYKHKRDELGRYIGLFLSVTVFVTCGYEQSIADMYYFSLASQWGVGALRVVLLASLGNLAGGLVIPAASKWKRSLDSKARGNGAAESERVFEPDCAD